MRSLTALLILIAASSAQASSGGFSWTGNFARDDDKREFFFSLAEPGVATIRTWSYAGGTNQAGTAIPAGGFDPTVSVFDSNGATVAVNQDGGCAAVSMDAATHSCWDAYLAPSLPAGNYRVVLTQSVNAPASGNLSDGFYFDGAGNFTQAPAGSAPGFWDFYPNQRTSAFALDIVAAASIAPAITSSGNPPFGITNTTYTPVTLTAIGAPGATFSWTVPTGPNNSIPPNMVLTSAGVLQGIPSASGIYLFTVQATDGVQPVQQTLTLTVYNPVSLITSPVLPGGIVSKPYGPIQLAAAGGGGAYSWSGSGLTLPPGLFISPTGVVSGLPTAAGTYSGSFTVTDFVTELSASRTFSISIATPALQISARGALGEIALGSAVSAAFVASGGTPPYTFSAGSVPPAGVTLNPATGVLSGTPLQPGNYSFNVLVTDQKAITAATPVTLSILGLTTTGIPNGKTNAPYSASFAAAGGSAPYSFAAIGIPAGLILATNGTVAGTPATPGTFVVQLTVTDNNSFSTAANFNLSVTGTVVAMLAVPGTTLGSGTIQLPYSDSVTALGGTAPYTWTVTGGTVPPGLTVSPAGHVTGTPTAAGSFQFTAHVTDNSNSSASGTFSIVIAPAALRLSTGDSLPNGIVGSEYPLQILTPSGGNTPYSFSISAGKPPDGLEFANGQISGTATASGTFSFSVTLTDGAGKTVVAPLAIVISPAQTDLILSQTFLSFSLMTGSLNLPAPASVTVRSSVVQQLLGYTYVLSTPSSWLSLTGGGNTPGSIGVSLTGDALALAPSGDPYQASIEVTCAALSPCAGKSQMIAVSLSVTAPPPQLAIDNALLSFNSTTSNAAPVSSSFNILNAGGSTLAIASVTVADSWASLSGVPLLIPSGPSEPVTVTVNPAGLAPGYYRTTVTVNSAAGSATLPISLLITGATGLALSPQGTQFQMAAGGALGNPSGSFSVLANGAGSISWHASVLPGAGWLTVTTTSGAANASSPGSVSYTLDPASVAALPAGTSYGTIRLTPDGQTNSPQDFHVVVTVTQPTAPVKPDPSPAGLLFTSGSPASQNVQLFASSSTPVAYQAFGSTFDGAAWLQVTPSTGLTSAGSPAQSSVSVNASGLKPGVYFGGVSYAFSGAAVRTVNVGLIVPASGQSLPHMEISKATTAACTPSQIVDIQVGLVNNFAALATLPTPLAVLVVDDCGNPVTSAQVSATFSNGDAPLPLSPSGTNSGIYTGTWTPLVGGAQVAVLASATAPGFTSVATQIIGEVTANAGPVLTRNATLQVYNPLIGGAVAPGTILQLYGSNLAAQPVTSSNVPLPVILGHTSVTIGGISAPLYYVSPTQINAQAPFELVAGNQYQVVVNVNGALTAPGLLAIAPAVPGIAAWPDGRIIAQHTDYTLVSETSPAIPGDYVVLYLAGLGITEISLSTGSASPANPLARPLIAPTLTLSGVNQLYQFAGATPGLVGLYQINFLVPEDTPEGDMQVIVSQSGVASNAVILPVHK